MSELQNGRGINTQQKANGKCGHCQKKESVRDSSVLRVILKRHVFNDMEIYKV